MKFFRYDGTAFRFLTNVCNLIFLNLLWIFTSLPLVTIGASTVALYTVTLKMARGEEGYIVRGFLAAFKRNFKQATVLWLIIALAGGWFFLFFRLMRAQDSDAGRALQLVEAALVVLCVLAALYAAPILARYDNTVKNTVRNAFVLSLRYLPYSVLMLGLAAAPVLLTAFVEGIFDLMMSLWISLGISSIALGISHLINRVFRRVEGSEAHDQESNPARV